MLKFPGAKAALRKLQEEEQRAQDDAAAPAPEPAPDPNTAHKDAFHRIRAIVGSRSPSIEPRPTIVSAQTAKQIEEHIARGAADFAAHPEPDLDNGFIIGFDFGTSSLKLAVRQPYKVGPSIAFLSVPYELRSGSHSHLWQTALWFDPENEAFSLFPQPGMAVLEGFKTGIIGGHGGERVHTDLPVTRAEAAIAYIALQMAHFLGWYAETRPLTSGGERFLSINVGIPVAAHDDEKAFKSFRHIVSAARELVPFAEKLTLSDVRKTHQSSSGSLPEGWYLIPELTAAIAGYTSEPTSLDGAHVLIDVGASTLDIVAFNHVRRERNAVISAGVELLGAAALEAARADNISDESFCWACDRQFHSVFGEACRPSRGSTGFHPDLRSRDVQLITTGGGCESSLHSAFIEHKNVPKILGSLLVMRPEPPASSVTGVSDPSRLLLAYGLTRDIPELLDLKLPSQVQDITPQKAVLGTYVSKDDV
ncbi:hypothetical protein K3179_00390 [Qipengyuania sp. GH38]|nr:hypothetical protein [Qipengyuania intermedia]